MKTIYLIGNAHIDPVWLWKKSEGLSEILSTYRSALDRMKEFPAYIFTSACAYYYHWVETIDPVMFQEIQQRVKEGRWSVTGGFWVQPDCNLPSGEAFCRHTLYSQRLFQQKLGVTAKVGYNVDSFGHNGMLPQLLKKSGMDAYVFMRPGNHENAALPDLFYWEAPDGSRVLTHKIKYEYTDYLGVPDGKDPITGKIDLLEDLSEQNHIPYMDFYGVGNHGGGPTIRGLRLLEKAVQQNPQRTFSSTEAYFKDVENSGIAASIPVVTGSLLHHASGCYAANAAIKKANRQAENALLKAEKFHVLAQHLTGCSDKTEQIRQAWEKVLFQQFHDILAGCSIREAYQDAHNALAAACDMAWEITQTALHHISWNIKTTRGLTNTPCEKKALILWEKDGEGAPIVVFNPHSFPVRHAMQLNTTVKGICDAAGVPVVCQKVRGPQTNGEDRYNTLFDAQIPAYGYSLFYVFKEQDFSVSLDYPAKAYEYTLENRYVKVQFDPFTGCISSFYDKENHRELAAGPMAKAFMIEDEKPDTWAHGITVFDRVVGEMGQAQFVILEQGPLRASVRTTVRYQNSSLQQDFHLSAYGKTLEVECRLNMQEHLKLIKLSFPVLTDTTEALYAIPYGYEPHPLSAEEFPAHKWVMAASKTGQGISLCNDSKYSFSTLPYPNGAELRMTIARGCIFADHYGVRDSLVEYQDQGEQSFRYSLSAETDIASVVRRANLLNMEPELLLETHHEGSLPAVYTGIATDKENIVISAIKNAEDGNGYILRLYETAGKPTNTVITFPLCSTSFQVNFAPQEIKTLRLIPENRTITEVLITEE